MHWLKVLILKNSVFKIQHNYVVMTLIVIFGLDFAIMGHSDVFC